MNEQQNNQMNPQMQPMAPQQPIPQPVQPQVQPQPQPNQQATSGDSITFDYNQLYANQIAESAPQAAVEPESTTASALQETPIVFAEDKKVEPEVVKNVIPTFDTRALEDNPDDETITTNEQLIHTIRPESQQEKEQYKKNLLFILVFFGVLIIAVWFIFPLLAGY